MKKRIFIVLFCALILVLSACVKEGDDNKEPGDDYMTAINTLEQKIELVLSEQSKEKQENKIEIEKLKAEISLLKKEESEESTTQESVTTPPPKASKFLYEINEGKATITGYTGDETYIVIPSFIDGYAVEAIGENAFLSSKITTVVISEGVKKVDWFAFYTCPYLSAVTIPSSVTSIGYSAFDGASPSFTVYCNQNSYAYQYAKSYGISCVVV